MFSQPAAAPGVIQVWWATPQPAGKFVELLDAGERDRLARLRRESDQDRFATGCALIRQVVGAHADLPAGEVVIDRSCATCGGPHGKPTVDYGQLSLSLSHSGDRVGLAVTVREPLGLDVEQFKPRPNPPLTLALTEAERADLARLPAAEQSTGFLRYWTRKEAVVKATGEGMITPLTGFSVSAPDAPARLVDWPARPGAAQGFWLTDLAPGDDHLASLAVITTGTPRVFEAAADALLAR